MLPKCSDENGTGCEGETLRANKNDPHTERIEIYIKRGKL